MTAICPAMWYLRRLNMRSYFFLRVESEYLATERQCRVVWR